MSTTIYNFPIVLFGSDRVDGPNWAERMDILPYINIETNSHVMIYNLFVHEQCSNQKSRKSDGFREKLTGRGTSFDDVYRLLGQVYHF